MEFKINTRVNPNMQKTSSVEYALAKRFSDSLQKELKDFLRAIVLFGSTTRRKATVYEPDIDVLIIIDDLTKVMSPEVVQTYRVITEKIAAGISKRFHITTLKLTTYWDYVRNGDPVVVNILRDGVPLFDVGIFEPVQSLLFQGRIRPTKESVWTYWARAPVTMNNSSWHILQATLDLYWAVIDAAHAALMQQGTVPPTPEHVADLIQQRLVKPGLCPKYCTEEMRFFYSIAKKIEHRQMQIVTGKEYDSYRKRAHEFVQEMKKVLETK